MQKKIENLKKEISKVVIGQENMIDLLLVGLFTNGHIILEGVPGLAKTTTVKALSSSLGLDFKRIQFTPDLLPSDIIGASIYDMKNSDFKIRKGPIFTNLLLADEINRAPAKVQSALLEVMSEYQVTISDTSFKLNKPFLVLATQNPIEQEGAYRLPEAQLDRFMFKIIVEYNSKKEELEIARKASTNSFEIINTILSKEDISKITNEIENVHIDKEVEEYIVSLVDATRNPELYELNEIKEYIFFGASPRATIDIFKASKGYSYIQGKNYVTPVDIAMIIKDILRHRIVLSYEAEINNITTDYIISKILEKVDIP
jgi:MoxR-like ATPase